MAEFVYVKGKCRWFRHVKPEEFNGKQTWKHTIYPDPESLEKIRELQAEGMRNVLKKDEDGYYIAFSRPVLLKKRDGTEAKMDPPVVTVGKNPNPHTDGVGDGSEIVTKLEVYTHPIPNTNQKAKAARWLSTIVTSLVPYEFRREKTERALHGLAEQTPPRYTF